MTEMSARRGRPFESEREVADIGGGVDMSYGRGENPDSTEARTAAGRSSARTVDVG
jgi:hypothetical protein